MGLWQSRQRLGVRRFSAAFQGMHLRFGSEIGWNIAD
jgi:hypothetical protein